MEPPVTMQPSMQLCEQVSDQESLAMVRIFLNAAIACVAHTRELIPWVSKCFQTCYINQLQDKALKDCDLYADFCSRRAIENDGSQEFRILLRGYDARADSILNFVDGGIAEALEQNFLEAFQLFIAKDVTDPASVLETYTFAFTYDDRRISQISIASDETSPFVVKNVHRNFSTSIRTLLRTLRGLPRLPRQRSLGISLLYNQDCPRDYQPDGFVDPDQHRHVPVRGSWSDIWQITPAYIADLRTGPWKIKLGAQSLQYTGGLTTSRLLDVKISAQLQQLQKTSSQNPDVTSTAVMLPSVNVNGSGAGDQKNGSLHRAPVNRLAKLSVASKNRRRRNVVTSKLAELLVQARALENTHRMAEIFDNTQLENGKIRRLQRTGDVRCECGSPHENEQILLCELCGTTQHKVCYGYESLRQGCLPEEHFCYNCLLLPRENRVNDSMPGIVHMRLALHFLASLPTGEVKIGQEFMQSIFRSRPDPTAEFLGVVERLVREGFISSPKGGVARILHDDNLLTRAQTAYLDPLASIVHHYQIVRDGDSFEKRKREVLKALKLYFGERTFSAADTTNSYYDRVHVKDSAGREAIRWGFYASWKRKRVDSPEASERRRRVSVANEFVSINKSTPSETMSIDDALYEAATDAEWNLRVASRLRSSCSVDIS